MNVIITIEGREAVPVRAIPFLTNWEVLSPDELAQALTGEDVFTPQFENLRAHRLDGNVIKAVNPNWWANFPVRELKALSDRIGRREITHETGYDEWRPESIRKLPAGVFLWRDEFEGCFWRKFGPNGETVLAFAEGGELKRQRRNESIQLDYDPFIPDPETSKLVKEGFAEQPLQPEPQAEAPAVGVSGGGAVPAPDPQASKRRTRTMGDAVFPYMLRVFEAGQFATAKELYRALQDKAGQSDSPFEVGTGAHRGSLFVREFSKPLALKTVQNTYWPKLNSPD